MPEFSPCLGCPNLDLRIPFEGKVVKRGKAGVIVRENGEILGAWNKLKFLGIRGTIGNFQLSAAGVEENYPKLRDAFNDCEDGDPVNPYTQSRPKICPAIVSQIGELTADNVIKYFDLKDN